MFVHITRSTHPQAFKGTANMYRTILLFCSFATLGTLIQTATAGIILDVSDAGAGATNWTLSGTGTASSFGPWSPFGEIIILSNFGNFSFVNGGDNIIGAGNWSLASHPAINTLWFGEGSLDGTNDWLYINFGFSIPNGVDLSTAQGTVVFPIPITAFSQSQYIGAAINPGSSASAFDSGPATINVAAVPEPTSGILICTGFTGAFLWRKKRSYKGRTKR